ncbi:MAG TPA: alpha/beta hydrolase [Caulobacteraceae bacterium]|jgi:pimeloyl-ACP methyl ester carboxylesterase|nr:alpha/beta hydrolase [Caulobacteraceae bacterium]
MLHTAAPVADEMIEMRGLRFHYRDWPSTRAGAPDLVLLHGYTGHARSWDAFAEAMTDRYRVLALDQRGHGETGWAPAEHYGVEDMADDLEAFVQALGLRAYSLVGLSMGGMVAMEYAGRRPKELAALVIVDIGPEIVTSGVERIQAGVRTSDIFASRDEAFAAARLANPLPPEAHHRHRVDYSLMRTEDGRWTWRYDRALRSGALRTRDAERAWRSCGQIAVPTQLIRGALSDILSPETAARMIEVIPDARLATVENSGHAIPLDAPDGFLAAARAFLIG